MVNPYRSLLPATVGFDNLLSTFEELNEMLDKKKPSYPPYNIYKLEKDNEYYIEMAVAGFDDDEIEVTREGDVLWVLGAHKRSIAVSFIHNGLAERDFKHKFVLNSQTGVEYITLDKGILTIKLVHNIPEEKKPIKFQINSKHPKFDRLNP